MEKICRVCLANHDELVNIFNGKPKDGFSIPDMIAQWSGHGVLKGDCLPEHICPSCLEDAQHEYIICVADLYQSDCHSQRAKDASGDHNDSDALVLPHHTWKFNGRDRNHILASETASQDAQTVISTPVDKKDNRLAPREKRFKCNWCPKAFRVKFDLCKHIRTHTGERPFQCPHCHWSFKQKDHLRRHMLVHTAVGPYSCLKCSRNFKSILLLQTHNLIHYKESLDN